MYPADGTFVQYGRDSRQKWGDLTSPALLLWPALPQRLPEPYLFLISGIGPRFFCIHLTRFFLAFNFFDASYACDALIR